MSREEKFFIKQVNQAIFLANRDGLSPETGLLIIPDAKVSNVLDALYSLATYNESDETYHYQGWEIYLHGQSDPQVVSRK